MRTPAACWTCAAMRARPAPWATRSRLYGPPNPTFALDYSQDLADADAVIFVFEWTTDLQFGDRLDWARLVASVPRQASRRDRLRRGLQRADRVRRRLQSPYRRSRAAIGRDVCDSLSDKILPADVAAAANERPAVPVSHLRPDLGDAARFRRQGVLHDLCRPHQVPVARHVAGAAGDRAGAGSGGARRTRRRGLGQAARMDGMAGSPQGELLCRSRLPETDRTSRRCRQSRTRRSPPP